MKKKIATAFKKHYDEIESEYDIISNYEGYKCVEVYTKNGTKYNMLDKNGNILCDKWYDEKITIYRTCYDECPDGILVARVRNGDFIDLMDKDGKLFFPNVKIRCFYGIKKFDIRVYKSVKYLVNTQAFTWDPSRTAN